MSEPIPGPELPPDLLQELREQAEEDGLTVAELVENALVSWRRQRHTVYMCAPVSGLLEGIYQGPATVGEILRHGDFGLGTFDRLDGEMMVLHGVVYQIHGDGSVNVVGHSETTPFASITRFTPLTEEHIQGDYPYDKFQELLDSLLPSRNILYALRATGSFRHVRTRSVPRQENYRPLVEVAREQPEFEFHDTDGDLAGFFVPEFMSSLNVPGFHLHFLNAERTGGGHLLSCHMTRAHIQVQQLDSLAMDLPVSYDYLTADFSRDVDADLEEAEH